MKIFYAVQATGNGHISRALEIIPFLKKYGQTDVFLSGNNYSLKNNLPIAYRSKGMSLCYDDNGGIDIKKTIGSIRFRKVWTEAKHLPIEKYDLVINDFECITSLACRIKKIPSIHFGHQASFQSKKVPRPDKKEFIGEWILKNYSKGSRNIGLHFKSYDQNIYSPIIKESILQASPSNQGHITVYLNHYTDKYIIKQLSKLTNWKFELFSNYTSSPYTQDNIKIFPVNRELFNQSLITCYGIITGAGFETPAEALYLGKKLMVIPMRGQYEQQCNAKALEDFNVLSIAELDEYFPVYFNKWIFQETQLKLKIEHSTEQIIDLMIDAPKNIFSEPINQEASTDNLEVAI